MTDARQNWIGARARAAASGDGFDLAALAEPSRALGRWPRSARADVEAALEAARSAVLPWRRTPRSERAHMLRAAARALEAAPDPGGAIAARLSLDSSELAPHQGGIGAELERAIAEERSEPAAALSGIAVHGPHWSEILREPARRLFSALVAGRTVVLLSDPRLPMAADALATALSRSELPQGVWSLLHDDGATCLRELLREADVDTICASGTRAEMKRLARESGSSRALDLVVLANRSHVVGLEDDPTSAAALVIATGFGRSRALSGQAPGQTGRVLCHERVFSRFTAALLAALDTDRDVSRPIPPVDERARAYAVRVRDLGIDEGATLLHPRSFDVSGPIVFTNVDPFSRVAGLSRPAPCVCLMRVSSDAAGAALAQSFDPPSTAELLSTSSEPEDDFEAR